MNGGNFRLSAILPGAIKSAVGINSSETALAGSATFTGTAENPVADGVAVSCKTDAAGTLYFDFSGDGTNWETFPTAGFTVAADIHEYHTAKLNGRSFRVRLVNDSGAQSYLRLYTYYGTHSAPNAPANQSLGRDVDANTVRIYADPQDEIVLGQRTGVRSYTKFAYLPDIDTTDNAIVITADPAKPALPEVLITAETFSIAYDDVNDGAGSNGALTLYFDYIDANGKPAQASHTLDGTTPDTTAFSGLGINRVAVSSSGSTDTNSGAITITSSTTGGVQAYIPAGEGVTQQAIYHTPSNAQAVAKFLFFNVNKLSGANPKVTIKGWAHNRAVDTKFEVFRYIMDTGVENHVAINEPIGFRLSAGDILYFTASTDTSNTVVGAMRFSLNEYTNNS